MPNKKKIAQVAKDIDTKELPDIGEYVPEEDTPAVPVETKPLTVEDKVNLLIEAQKISDQNFKTISEFMTKIEPLVGVAQQIEEQKQMQEANPQAKPQKGGLPFGIDPAQAMQALQVLGPILGVGNSGSSGLTDELLKEVIHSGIEQMRAGTMLLSAVQKRVLMNVGADIAQDITGKPTQT